MYRTKVSTRLALQFKISFSFVVFCFAASLRISFFTNIDSLSLRFLLLFFFILIKLVEILIVHTLHAIT